MTAPLAFQVRELLARGFKVGRIAELLDASVYELDAALAGGADGVRDEAQHPAASPPLRATAADAHPPSVGSTAVPFDVEMQSTLARAAHGYQLRENARSDREELPGYRSSRSRPLRTVEYGDWAR